MLKTMPHCFEFDESEISTLPIWIKLPGLPLDLWNSNVLVRLHPKWGSPSRPINSHQPKRDFHMQEFWWKLMCRRS